MANLRTITSADAVLLIGITGYIDVAQRVQGFSSDDITDTDAVEPVETSMGLDGRLSAGFVPVSTRQNITLQADSESIDFFENWDALEQATRTKYVAFGTLLVPATSRTYAMTRGFLRGWSRTPALKRSLQPRRATIEWERITPAPN